MHRGWIGETSLTEITLAWYTMYILWIANLDNNIIKFIDLYTNIFLTDSNIVQNDIIVIFPPSVLCMHGCVVGIMLFTTHFVGRYVN